MNELKCNQNGGRSTSTQSATSEMCAKSLLKDHYSEAEEMDHEQFEWIELGEGFYAVGKPGVYTLCFGNDCVCGEKFGTIEEAKHYVEKKPWQLILMCSAIYAERIRELKK